jgi:hypothetical protein
MCVGIEKAVAHPEANRAGIQSGSSFGLDVVAISAERYALDLALKTRQRQADAMIR